MTLRHSLVLLAVLCLATASEARAQEVQISIETIESDQFISGQVRGLEAAEIPRHRVVVYVHTDIWYIHPDAGQGEGPRRQASPHLDIIGRIANNRRLAGGATGRVDAHHIGHGHGKETKWVVVPQVLLVGERQAR